MQKKKSKMVYRFYLFISENGEVRYNCSILDLHDRSIIASITENKMTSELAVRTLKKALESQPKRKKNCTKV